jgi:drug/metabolite transporter (DMT)-like permease
MTVPAATRAPASPAAVWGALVVVYVVWGSTYLAIRVIVRDMPPLLAMGARFLVAGLVLAAIIAARKGTGALRVDRRQLGSAGLVGVLLLLGGNGMVAVGEQTVPSGLAALIVSATPLWIVLLRLSTGDRPRAITILGTFLGFAGIAVLARPGSVAEDVELWGILLVIAATMSWSVGAFSTPRLPMPVNPFVATTYEMLLGGAAMVLVGSARGEWRGFDPSAVSLDSWLWLGYLVTIGSLAAFSAFVWLLGNAPLSLVATYAYVNPVVAVALGALVLDESITTAVVVGGLIVVAGVALVVTQERPRRATPAPTPEEPPLVPAERVT